MTKAESLLSDVSFVEQARALPVVGGRLQGVSEWHRRLGGEAYMSRPHFERIVKAARGVPMPAQTNEGIEQRHARAEAIRSAIVDDVTLAQPIDATPKQKPETTDGPKWSETPNGATIEGAKLTRVQTLEELLENARVDPNVWEVERHVVNQWEVGVKLKDTNGALVVHVEPLFQVKAWLHRIPGVTALRELHAMLLEDLAAHAPAYPVRVKAQGAQPYLLEVSPFDLHVGKLAWGAEVDDENYDSKIAADVLDAAITDLLSKAAPFRPERILFPVGNDLLHTDGPGQMTTAGTPQDADTRHARIFRRATQLMIRAIDRLELVAPVDVIIVPGNHDFSSSFKLGEVLSAWYRNAERVTVDNGPAARKYYRYGTCLLGFTHGSDEKHSDLPMILAQERPNDWSATTCRELHIGHLHKRKASSYNIADTHNGVIVRILPSLSGTDAWHARKGYVKGPRAMEAYLFHHDTGYAGHFSANHRTAA